MEWHDVHVTPITYVHILLMGYNRGMTIVVFYKIWEIGLHGNLGIGIYLCGIQMREIYIEIQ